MSLFDEYVRHQTRRKFLSRSANAAGWATLASIVPHKVFGQEPGGAPAGPGPHFPPSARQVIYLHMVGGPSQMDLYDYKPVMNEWYDKDLPDSVRMGQRLTTMTSGQKRFPVAPSKFKIKVT